jgi:hypothetical protein
MESCTRPASSYRRNRLEATVSARRPAGAGLLVSLVQIEPRALDAVVAQSRHRGSGSSVLPPRLWPRVLRNPAVSLPLAQPAGQAQRLGGALTNRLGAADDLPVELGLIVTAFRARHHPASLGDFIVLPSSRTLSGERSLLLSFAALSPVCGSSAGPLDAEGCAASTVDTEGLAADPL